MRPWAQAFAASGGKPAAGLFRYVEESALSHEGGRARIQVADKVRGAGGSSPCRGLGQTPGRSIVAEGAGRAHRSFRSPPLGRFALCATAHRADASLRCPKPCAAAQKSERCECPKGTRNAPRSNTLLSCMTHKRRGHPPPGGAAPPLFQKTLSLERPAFLAPFGRSQRSRLLLRQRFLGRCPKPRQGPEAPAPHSFPCVLTSISPSIPAKPAQTEAHT